MEDEDEFLDFIVPRIESLNTEQLEDVLDVATGVRPYEADKIEKCYHFITDTVKELDKIPAQLQYEKQDILNQLSHLEGLLDNYAGGSLKPFVNIMNKVKQKIETLSSYDTSKLDDKSKTFVKETLKNLSSFPEGKSKQTILKNITLYINYSEPETFNAYKRNLAKKHILQSIKRHKAGGGTTKTDDGFIEYVKETTPLVNNPVKRKDIERNLKKLIELSKMRKAGLSNKKDLENIINLKRNINKSFKRIFTKQQNWEKVFSTGTRHYETDKIEKYYYFIANTVKELDNIPTQLEISEKEDIINQLDHLKQLLDNYAGGPLVSIVDIANEIKQRVEFIRTPLYQSINTLDDLSKNFINDAIKFISTCKDCKVKNTALKNIGLFVAYSPIDAKEANKLKCRINRSMVTLKSGSKYKTHRGMINDMFQNVSMIQDQETRAHVYSKVNQLLELSDLHDSGQIPTKSNQYRTFKKFKDSTNRLITNILKKQNSSSS